MGSALYDRIGQGYTSTRRPDPRIAAMIQDALGEPSRHMIQQRAEGAAPAVQAFAEALPFTAQAFDAALAVLTIHIGSCRVETVTVPCDCVDGFLAAYWRRPEAYLDPAVRAGMSGFAALDGDVIARGVANLEADLKSGVWERRFGHLRSIDALDAGYRLLVAS